ncbi:unnamed protein product, partial [Pocillopora meandrina]
MVIWCPDLFAWKSVKFPEELANTFIALKVKSQKIPGEQSTNTREKRLKRERNVLKLSVTIVLGFALCWLPLNYDKVNRMTMQNGNTMVNNIK